MKFLLDMGLATRTAAFLRGLGHDAVHLSELGQSRLPDPAIMQLAVTEGRVIITFDLDFPRILALQRLAQPSLIVFRLEQFTTDEIHDMFRDIIVKYANDLQTGAVVVVEPARIRVRSLPIF